MKNIPKEIDLYSWYDYSFFRAVLKLPIPSPRVWDNSGTFGFTSGRYLKDSFFEPDFFEPSLYTKEKLTNYIKEKYGNKLRLEKGKGKLMKSDKSNHKFVKTIDNNHLYLDFENFIKIKNLKNNLEYEEIYEAIKEIYSLTTSNYSAIDAGYFAPEDHLNYYSSADKKEQKWINFNLDLESAIESNSGENPIELLYESIYKFFDYPSKKLWKLNEILKNDFWFVDMFRYSFKPKTLRWLKGNQIEKKEPIIKKIKTSDLSPNDEKVRESIKKTANFVKKYPKKNSVILPGIILVGLVYLIIGNFSQFNSNNQPQKIIVEPPKKNDPPKTEDTLEVLKQLCTMCKITGTCDSHPFCTKSQKTCEWEQNWNGNWVEKCTSF